MFGSQQADAAVGSNTRKMRSSKKTPPAKAETDDAGEGGATSLKIFRSFLNRNPDGSIDASGVVSKECFNAWVDSRKKDTRDIQKAFRKSLSGHITSLDGRTPFTAEEEVAVLQIVRRKVQWPCFEGTNIICGRKGFRSQGFHERIRAGTVDSITSATNKSAQQYLSQAGKRTSSSPSSPQAVKRRKQVVSSTSSSSSLFHDDDDDGDENEAPVLDVPSVAVAPHRTLLTGPLSSKHASLAKATANKPTMVTAVKGESEETIPLSVVALEDGYEPPRLPIINGREPQSNFFNLFSSLETMVSKLKDFSQLWRVLYGFGRMRVIGRGWVSSPSIELATAIMNQLEEQYPNDYFFLFEFTSNNYVERMIVQNDVAFSLFGGLSRAYGGFRGKRFLRSEVFALLKAIAAAFSFPGREVHLRSRFFLRVSDAHRAQWTADTLVETAYFDVYFHVHEESHLLIERGVYVGPAPPLPAASAM